MTKSKTLIKVLKSFYKNFNNNNFKLRIQLLPQLESKEMNCALHKTLPLQYFCETCLDPICAQCIKSNPHSNEFHNILSIQEAVDIRKQAFKQYVETQIDPLRTGMRQKLEQLKLMEGKQVEKKNIIMKDIMLQFEAIDQRTKEKAEKSILQYQTQIKYYQSYLNSLDDLAYTFDKTSSDPYNLLILYQDFINQLKSLELKEIKEKIDQFQIFGDLFDAFGANQTSKISQEVRVKDPREDAFRKLQFELNLPRQIKTTFQQVSKLTSLRERNQTLNALIATACQNYQNQEKKSKSNAQIKYKNQLHLFNNANQNIIALNQSKACAFCGITFTLEKANDQCIQNKSIKTPLNQNYLNLTVLPQFRGTKRHYWVDSSLSSRSVPNHNVHLMLKPESKRAFQNSLKELNIIKCCFRKYEINHCAVDTKAKTATINSFMRVFEQADKQKKGTLSKITFKYLLTKTFQMNPTHGDILTELLSFNWLAAKDNKLMEQGKEPAVEQKIPQKLQKIDGVNYRLLKDLVQNPLFPYEQWKRIDNENDKSKPCAPQSQNKGGYLYGAKI